MYETNGYKEEDYGYTANCIECGSSFNFGEDCPVCENTRDENEVSHEIKIENIEEIKETRSPIYDTERERHLERKIEEVSKKLEKIDEYHIERVSNLWECVSTIDGIVVDMQKQNFTEELNDVKKHLNNQLDRAHKVDQDVMDLQEKAENKIDIKEEFKILKAEVHKEFENQVEVIHT